MSRRTSARLANMKGKSLMNNTDEMIDDLGYDSSEQVQSEDEPKPSPRKRQRATTKSATTSVRKKQVRGKLGRLAGLVNMPVDIFTEILSYLLPIDLISLARSNKFFRSLLMSRSATHIWHGAMRNVEDLPPCPPGISEPQYITALFTTTCTLCGAPSWDGIHPVLVARLCKPCRKTQLIALNTVPLVLKPWILSGHWWGLARAYVLRHEVSILQAQYEEVKGLNDSTALGEWIQRREEFRNVRQERGKEITEFLESLAWDRQRKLTEIKSTREFEIKRRLIELGWTKEDMRFDWQSQRIWSKLVSQPKPLTDRIWANLQTKLIPMLEANRQERLEAEREARKRGRKERLCQLFLNIKKKSDSVLEFKTYNPVPRFASTVPTICITHRSAFPSLAHTLEWPLVQELYDTDSSAEEMRARFEEHQEEIETLVAEWKVQFQSHFVDLLRAGCESTGEALRPNVAACDESSDLLANVSDDLKLLLRADSLFYNTASDDPSRAYPYNHILSTEGLTGSPYSYGSTDPETALNPDDIHWYPEAHEMVRALLADMGRPDASYLQMMGVGAVFMCGRCHDTEHRSWDDMVHHYIEQKRIYAGIQEDGPRLSDEGIAYNDIHDPARLTDRPMVIDCATKIYGDVPINAGCGIQLHDCKVCERIPAAGEVAARRWRILKHLSDVHGIAEPKIGEHYSPKSILLTGINGVIPWELFDDHDCVDHITGDYIKDKTPSNNDHTSHSNVGENEGW